MKAAKVEIVSPVMFAFNQDVSVNPYPKYPGDPVTTSSLDFIDGGIKIVEKPAMDFYPMRADYGKK